MKIKLATLSIIVTFISILSCKNEAQKTEIDNSILTDTITKEDTIQNNPSANFTFDIDNYEISTSDWGEFPFFELPEGTKYLNPPKIKNFDVLYIPINGNLVPMEGKVFRAYVKSENGNNDFSYTYFTKSMNDFIISSGGHLVSDAEITKEAYEANKSDMIYLGEDASIGYAGQKVKTYLIRRMDASPIYIVITGDNNSAYLNILEIKEFEQTIKPTSASQIEKDLTNNGKSILNINFDTNKATLKSDGKSAVHEITLALKNNPALKISINGHTDNAGIESNNMQLSKNRALTVYNEVVSQGISKDRLQHFGFGSQKPIAENTSEEGKAKNRRVELIKI